MSTEQRAPGKQPQEEVSGLPTGTHQHHTTGLCTGAGCSLPPRPRRFLLRDVLVLEAAQHPRCQTQHRAALPCLRLTKRHWIIVGIIHSV